MTSDTRLLEATILIVDDQALSVRLLEQIVKSAGYFMVRSTTDPTQVVDLCRGFQPDLLLLDLVMPGLDGFGVMEQLQELAPELRPSILVITDSATPQIRTRALRAGAVDVLLKPYDRHEILSRVSHLLDQRAGESDRRAGAVQRQQTPRPTSPGARPAAREGSGAYRDDATGLHVVRVGEMAARLGRAAGLAPDHCQLLQGAARFHDIGELAIPDQILQKTGGLDSAEFEVLKQHTVIGARMLAHSDHPLLQMAEQIALSHHEKWDGSGYPGGLRGEAIPLVSRICAVCDVFDVLTEDRPFRAAWPVDGALAEIARQGGRHFDPQLVDLFRGLLGEMLTIKQQFKAGTDRPPDIDLSNLR